MDKNERMINIAKLRSFISLTVLSPNASVTEVFLPIPEGGVAGRYKLKITAKKPTADAKKKGILVPSKRMLKLFTMIMLKTPETTQPTEPNTRIRENCSG